MTTHSVTIWFARVGPCWCTGRPGASGSQDLERLRRTEVPASRLLDRDVVVTPDRLTPTLLPWIRSLLEGDVVSVAYPLCQQAISAMPSDLVPVFENIRPPSTTIDVCVSGYPEALLAALSDLAATDGRRGVEQRLAGVG